MIEILDKRLLRIHELWKNPPSLLVKSHDGIRLASSSSFKIPALPLYHKFRFRDEYELPPDDIDWWFIAERNEEGHFFAYTMFDMLFERSVWIRLFPSLTSKIIVQILSSKFSSREEMFNFFCEIHLDDFGNFIRECGQYEYPWKYIQEIVNKYFTEKLPFVELTLKYPFLVNNNVAQLETLCDSVLRDNPKSVEDYRKGKLNSINHLKGQVMKITKGTADVKLVAEILERKLKKQ